MWAYDDGRGRRARDIPSSRPANYYDDAYERAPPRSSRHAYPEAKPKHRRKSALVDPDEPRPRRSNPGGGGVNVVASDDGSGYPYGASPRDAYHKTGDRERRFREKRDTYEVDEAEKLRRAKSHSPRRAAREAEAPRRVSPQAPKSAWPEDEYAAQAGAAAGAGAPRHRSSKKSKAPQYYGDDDPYASYYASQAPRGKKGDRGGYGYAPSAEEMPRPPMGDNSPYKSSPSDPYAAAEEKPSKHQRKRDKERDYYGAGYDDYAAPPKAGTSYDRGVYGAAANDDAPPPRRSRKHHDDRAGADDYGYPPQPQPQHRGRHRGAPQPAGDYGDTDPYDRAPPARPRHRQSMPPQPRSQYPDDDPYGDPYGQQAPRRRATSVNYGRNQDRYGGGGGGGGYYDDAYGGRASGSPSGSSGSNKRNGAGAGGNKKGKAYAQQAGKLFMTHAVPVIKKEAVPFLTKAAQAYFEQQKR